MRPINESIGDSTALQSEIMKAWHNKILSDEQEEGLCDYIRRNDRLGLPPRLHMIRGAAIQC